MCEKGENLLEKKGQGNEYYIVYIRFFVGRMEVGRMALPNISTPKVKTVNKDLEAWDQTFRH